MADRNDRLRDKLAEDMHRVIEAMEEMQEKVASNLSPMLYVGDGLHLIYVNPVARLTIRQETLDAIAQLLKEYPGADEELTYDVNAFIMQHIENTRKELGTDK